MHLAYVVSVYLHILAAVTWLGGMLFLVLVVVPWLRRGDRAQAGYLMRETGLRFRTVGWVSFAVLLVTGSVNLWLRGVRFSHFVDPSWLASPFGRAVSWKLGLFAVVLAISVVHDFVHGPRATEVVQRDPASPEAEALRKRASLLGRANLLLGLAIVWLAVILVRGWP